LRTIAAPYAKLQIGIAFPAGETMMRSIRFAVCAVLALAGTVPAGAQANYPEGSIRLIYGFSAGTDTMTRMVADKLAAALGKPVVVDNVTGAGGNIAADRTAKANPDGYTIGMLTGANITINVSLYNKLPFDPVKDLAPITQAFGYPNMLVVNNDVPAKSVAELVALARTRPGTLTFGHSGIGTTQHLSGEVFKTMAGINIQGVPYRGPPQIVTDLLSGQLTMSFNTPLAVLPLTQEGKLRALAVTSRNRVAFVAHLPTMEESGFPGFETTVWFGLFAPARTPKSIIDRLNRESVKITALPEMRKKLDDFGYVPLGNTPEQFAELIKTETPYWARVIKDAGIKPID
jgi:tripartite-type tricarboxylate transporter receptor subunit TctC